MSKLDIVMFNMSSYREWEQGIQNRNYHIAHTLLKMDDVNTIIAVDFLPFNFRQTVKRYLYDIVKRSHTGDIVYGDLTSLCYQHSSKLYTYSTIDSYLNPKRITRELDKILKRLNIQNPIIWSYSPLFLFYHEQPFFQVFDSVDNWLEHNAYIDHSYQKRLLKNYRSIAVRSDLIFTVSPHLIDFYKENGRVKNTLYIPNGVDADYFYNSKHPDTIVSEFLEEQKRKGKKILGYIGTIQCNRFDTELIDYIAKEHSDKIIALCGPIWKDSEDSIRSLRKHKNIYFTGPVSRLDWMNYCSYFDVALNPHLVNFFTHYTSPTKIYEYLACGKPVVTTNVCGAEEFSSHIYVGDNKKLFSQLINQAILNDTQEIQKERKDFIMKNCSWDIRVDNMVKSIKTSLC